MLTHTNSAACEGCGQPYEMHGLARHCPGCGTWLWPTRTPQPPFSDMPDDIETYRNEQAEERYGRD